eukprot:1161948-Pelagomonas_calceolata.AAC.7
MPPPKVSATSLLCAHVQFCKQAVTAAIPHAVRMRQSRRMPPSKMSATSLLCAHMQFCKQAVTAAIPHAVRMSQSRRMPPSKMSAISLLTHEPIQKNAAPKDERNFPPVCVYAIL